MADNATLEIRVPGFPQPISFADWVHDRFFSTCQLAHGQSTEADVFASGPGQPIQGGTRALTKIDTNLERAGTNGLSSSNEMLCYNIKISMRARGVTAGNAALTDHRVCATLSSLFDLKDKVYFEFRYAGKARCGGPITDFPQGGGIQLFGTANALELATNGGNSARDAVSFVLPLWLKPNIGFNGMLTPAVALVQNWAMNYTPNVPEVQTYADVSVELEGLRSKPVN